MEFTVFITIIGTVASIFGAIIAIHQAYKSKQSADTAENVRIQLIQHRRTSELATLYATCKKAQKSMEKYGPAATSISLQGLSQGAGAEDVQDFILFFNENVTLFNSSKHSEIIIHLNKLKSSLKYFVDAKSFKEKKQWGSEILFMLNSMVAYIKNNLDEERDNI